MKTKITLLMFLGLSSIAFCQDFEKLLFSKKDRPTFLINNNVIGHFEMLNTIPSDKIKKVEVIKSYAPKVDKYLSTYPNLTQYGILLVTADWKGATRSQKELRNFFDMEKDTKVYVDGFLLKDEKYVIAASSIQEIEIITPEENNYIDRTIINVWTLKKDQRLGNLFLLEK